MKKSILVSFMVIGAVAAMITAATSAVFTDQVTSTGSTFAAGTLKMSVDTNCAGRAQGSSPGNPNSVPETGCNTGVAKFTVTNQKPGDPASTGTFTVVNYGSLPGTLTVTPSITGYTGGCLASDYIISNGPIVGTNPIPAAGSVTYAYSIQLKSTAGNVCQGQSLSASYTFDLAQ